MKTAMILAAGRGRRMGTLTDNTPKPLCLVGGISLIEHRINDLVKSGITRLVINHAYLGRQITDTLGDGKQLGASISYSAEETGLETAGGIINALPLLGEGAFLVVNSDIWTDYDFATLPSLPAGKLAHLILVANPPHHPGGDFSLNGGALSNEGDNKYTYSGIGLYHPDFFKGQPQGKQALAPLLRAACDKGLVSGSLYRGYWIDVGTPERLEALQGHLNTSKR